ELLEQEGGIEEAGRAALGPLGLEDPEALDQDDDALGVRPPLLPLLLGLLAVGEGLVGLVGLGQALVVLLVLEVAVGDAVEGAERRAADAAVVVVQRLDE